MFNATPGSTQYTPVQNGPAISRSLSLCYVDIPDQMVTSSVDAIISRMAPAYLELMREAKEKSEIISDYKSSLYDYYKDMCTSLTPEMRTDVREAQKMAQDCNVITKMLPSERRISVFLKKNREFDENQALDKASVYIRLSVKAKDIKEEDPLDHLLSQLSKKILSQGYGGEGTFDIRLEKGCLSLEGDPWRWHFDGNIFKTSVTVCYSNKENWSTRVSDSKMESNGRPADHGFLYDALNVYHRAPIPSDLEGEELNANDYRLFIRYKEFYTKGERIPIESEIPDRDGAEKEERRTTNFSENPFRNIRAAREEIPSWLSDYKSIHKITELERLLSKGQSSTIPLSNLLDSQYANQLVDTSLIKSTCVKYFENLLTPIQLDFTHLIVPKYNFSELFAELGTRDETDSKKSG